MFAFSLSVWTLHLGQTKRLSLFLLIGEDHNLTLSQTLCLPVHLLIQTIHLGANPSHGRSDKTEYYLIFDINKLPGFRNWLDSQANLKMIGSLFCKTRQFTYKKNYIVASTGFVSISSLQ